jgi:hypothetical protein
LIDEKNALLSCTQAAAMTHGSQSRHHPLRKQPACRGWCQHFCSSLPLSVHMQQCIHWQHCCTASLKSRYLVLLENCTRGSVAQLNCLCPGVSALTDLSQVDSLSTLTVAQQSVALNMVLALLHHIQNPQPAPTTQHHCQQSPPGCLKRYTPAWK